MSLVTLKKVLTRLMYGNGKDHESLLPTHERHNDRQNAFNRSSSMERGSSDTLSDSQGTLSEGFVAPRVMSNIIIGLSDGLTVPFALTAGLSGLGDAKVVITAGLAELVSGAISMGLGGYLAEASESEYFDAQVEKEKGLLRNTPALGNEVVADVLKGFGISPPAIDQVIADLDKKPRKKLEFVIKFGKGLEQPEGSRKLSSAFTIGMSYFLGGFVPLLPYFFTSRVQDGLVVSVIVMAITLFAFGAIKTVSSLGVDCGGWRIMSNGLKMLLTGGSAAGAAWGLVKLIDK